MIVCSVEKAPKRRFPLPVCHLYIKMMILPRQAQNKHRENSKKSGVFRTGMRLESILRKRRRFFFFSAVLAACHEPVLVKVIVFRHQCGTFPMFVPSLSWQKIVFCISGSNEGVFPHHLSIDPSVSVSSSTCSPEQPTHIMSKRGDQSYIHM
jgi:hypothetical protein